MLDGTTAEKEVQHSQQASCLPNILYFRTKNIKSKVTRTKPVSKQIKLAGQRPDTRPIGPIRTD